MLKFIWLIAHWKLKTPLKSMNSYVVSSYICTIFGWPFPLGVGLHSSCLYSYMYMAPICTWGGRGGGVGMKSIISR
jgi:hypothetical protein